jgi:hypothetical protein
MRTYLVVLGVALLHSASGCTKPQASTPTEPAAGAPATEAPTTQPEMVEGQSGPMVYHRLMAGEPDADAWYPAASTEGAFSVRLPGRFNDFTLPTTRGPMYIIGAVLPDGTRFAATAFRPPDLKEAVEQMYARADGTDPGGQAKRVRVGGLEGVEFRAARPGMNAGAVCFLHSDSTVYTLVVECPQGPMLPPGTKLPDDLERDAAIFFQSFRLK